MSPDRELRAEVTVDADPARVWRVITDFRNIIDASPELFAMTSLTPGPLKAGKQYIGWNRRKGVVWTSRNVIIDAKPNARLAWDTKTSGARWIFDLKQDGKDRTRLVQTRPVPKRLTTLGKVFAKLFLGGGAAHTDELEAAMTTTLKHLKAVAER